MKNGKMRKANTYLSQKNDAWHTYNCVISHEMRHFSLELCHFLINELTQFIMNTHVALALVEYRYQQIFDNSKIKKLPSMHNFHIW